MSFSKQVKNTLNVVVIGDASVGKTSLLCRYTSGTFSGDYRTTVGADFISSKIDIDEKKYGLQVWDTAGQERYQSIGAAFYRGSDCCLVVFDITNRKSFESVSNWMELFLNQGEIVRKENFPFVIIGNKCDRITEREVSREEAESFCQKRGIGYFETSAKEGVGIAEAFEYVARKGVSMIEQDSIPKPATVTLTNNLKNKKADKPDCQC